MGLGARCAGVRHTDPGAEIGEGPPLAKVRIDGHPISLWPVLTSDADVAFDRSVFAGEAHGRWLWLVLRPASAALLLKDEWVLMDIADLGPGADGPAVRRQPARAGERFRAASVPAALGSRRAHRPPHPLEPLRRDRVAGRAGPPRARARASTCSA